MKGLAVVLMGSERDMEFSREIARCLGLFGVGCVFRVASAHKTPLRVLEVLEEYADENVVFVTVAGRSNALSAFVDANTVKPVIACPPYSEKFGGVDVFSSLRVPSGVGLTVVLEPEAAAIAVAKIFAVEDKALAKRIAEFQKVKKCEIEKADAAARKLK